MSKTLLIENTTIVTMNPANEILTHASLAIAGEWIEAIGPSAALSERYPDAERLDGRGKALLPGLINAHTHVSMSLQKGTTLMFDDGLYRIMWPVEKALTPEACYIGSLAGAAEAVKCGATTLVDHYFYAEQTARAVCDLGVRAVVGHTIMSRLGPITGPAELEAGIRFVSDWRGKHPLVTPWLAPHATDTVSRDWLVQLRQIASQEGIGLHLHLAQSLRERAYIQETYGKRCVEYLDDLGFLGPDVIAAHCIFIDDDEIELLARSGAHPVYCPMGHSLYGRPARAWQMLQSGAKVLLATDCVTSNNVMDMLGELRMAGAAQKQLTGDARAMPAARILEIATRDAAQAIGMGDRLGVLAPGYLADLILVNIAGLNMAPNYSLLDNLVYCCTGRDVDTVIVNGQTVVRSGILQTADEAELVKTVESGGRRLIRKAVEQDPSLNWLWKDDSE